VDYREEKDSMGIVSVPENAYYGAQTQRAKENFPDSGLEFSPAFIRALAVVKRCGAQVNRQLGLLDKSLSDPIIKAAQEVMDGGLLDQFVVDVFQTGSGTSTNMNMNEVLASRANEFITGNRGGKSPVHPNDHVNLGQSSNDVIPTSIHIAAAQLTTNELVPALKILEHKLTAKASEFADIKKIGRTHLQDAVPMNLGQAFGGYARQVTLGIERLESSLPRLYELALGGTAVGTGINTHPKFAPKTIKLIRETTGLPFKEAENHFAAQAAQDAAVEASGALKTIATSLVKIANDVRWLGCGPRCGIGEVNLPPLQPGSSIMPGKVNPVIPESVIQIAYQVMGNDVSITLGGQAGHFELNTALPLIAYNLIQSIVLLESAVRSLAEKCIDGLSANEEVCKAYIEKSLALATSFVPHIGYDKAAALAKKAYETGRTIRDVALEEKVLSEKLIDEILNSD
jgi:fumarate hydratase class II